MKIELGIGKRTDTLTVNDNNLIAVLTPNKVEYDLTGEAEVRRALREPIGAKLLRDTVKKGEKIAIITSDITRPVPSYKILPSVLEELYSAGVEKEDITVVLALGSHRGHTGEEQRRLVGDAVYDSVKVVDSNPDDCIHMGETKIGTPVDITRTVAEADRRICIGNVEYHYFAGYSGGAKAIMPGVSTRAAIQSNHSMMVRDECCAGRLEGNPIREDIEDAANVCGVDYIVNVVLDEHKEIIKCAAGDVTLAHRELCAFLDKLFCVKIPRRSDIVVASQGGAPKDLNVYQTQKALDNTKHAVRSGGIIILVGSCAEGMGEKTFEAWMREAQKPSDLTERIAREFRLGGHKAAAIAMVLQNAEIYLVSDLPDGEVEKMFMKPFKTVQEAYDAALTKLGENAETIVMPYGGSTLPREEKVQ